jgi:hypothetical protein
VKSPTVEDWGKLVRMMQHLKLKREDVLTLSADDQMRMRWRIDAAFAVHPDFKSHTGEVLTLGRGAIIRFCE